jgi:hypothetical protein
MKRLKMLGTLALLLLSPILVSATDVNIFPTGPIYKITPALVWGTSTQPGFNNNYFFTPLAINESVCVFVYNNNTTSAHTFTAAIQVTGDPASIGPSTGTWQSAANTSGLSAPVSPGFPAGLGASVTGAAQVSVNFSASSTQTGSPDTANVVIVQTSGNCFSGNQFIGSAPQSVSLVPIIQTVSDGLSQGFLATSNATGAGAAISLLGVNNSVSSTKSLYYDRVLISCAAACSGNVNAVSTFGTGGVVVTPLNLRMGSSVTSSSQSSSSQTAPGATISGIFGFQIGAGQSLTVDLRGLIAPSATTNGVSMSVIITGNVSTTFFWYEK